MPQFGRHRPGGTLEPGTSVAVTPAADDEGDRHCGNEPHFVIHIHIHGPGPGPLPGWMTAGPANMFPGSAIAAY